MGKPNVSTVLGAFEMTNELFFNELCLQDMPMEYCVYDNFLRSKDKLREFGFTKCRVSIKEKKQLFDYLMDIPGSNKQALRNFLYGFLVSPFEREGITEEMEEDFINEELCFEGKSVNGLAWAHLFNSIAFSLLTNKKWDCNSIYLIDGKLNSILVHHASTVATIESLKDWIDSLSEVNLKETSKRPSEKEFKIRDDHGGDELLRFWMKIRNCKYVVSCINSLPFNPHERDIIRTINANGQIEMVLTWTDKGIGMVIQTTGRNYRETKAIADFLRDKYSR